MTRPKLIDILKQIESIQPLPTVKGGFRTIVADPPWWFNHKGSRIAADSKEQLTKGRGYPCLTNEALLFIPVAEHAAPRSHIYMWTTDAFLLGGHFVTLADGSKLEVGFAPVLMQAWGFVPKCTLVWGKMGETEKVQIGMGNWFRHAHEICIFGVRGGVTGEEPHNLASIDAGSIILAAKGKHSKKPEEIFATAVKMSQGPRLEMFSRQTREGWHTWGNEIEPQVAMSK